MHKQRIIGGIEKVFESYVQDGELREALRESRLLLELFPKYNGRVYCLKGEGIFVRQDGVLGSSPSSARFAAEDYLEYLRSQEAQPLNPTKVKMALEELLNRERRDLILEASGYWDTPPRDRPRELRSGLYK